MATTLQIKYVIIIGDHMHFMDSRRGEISNLYANFGIIELL